MSHLSDKQFKRIKSDTEALAQLVSVLATGVQQSKVFVIEFYENEIHSNIFAGKTRPAEDGDRARAGERRDSCPHQRHPDEHAI